MLKELDLSPYIIIKHTPTHTCMPFNTYTYTDTHTDPHFIREADSGSSRLKTTCVFTGP